MAKNENIAENSQGKGLALGHSDNRLQGTNADEIFNSTDSTDVIFGGAGIDTVIYTGSIFDYLNETTDNLEFVSGLAGTFSFSNDTLKDIEVLQFDDYTYYLDGTNNAPISIADELLVTDEDSAVSIDVSTLLANDLEFDGDSLSIVEDSISAQNGTVELIDGVLTYTPDETFQELNDGEVGSDLITYTISDGNGGTTTAQLDVTVNGLDDGLNLEGLINFNDLTGWQIPDGYAGMNWYVENQWGYKSTFYIYQDWQNPEDKMALMFMNSYIGFQSTDGSSFDLESLYFSGYSWNGTIEGYNDGELIGSQDLISSNFSFGTDLTYLKLDDAIFDNVDTVVFKNIGIGFIDNIEIA